mgnify:CR=1 FL=1
MRKNGRPADIKKGQAIVVPDLAWSHAFTVPVHPWSKES